MDEDTIRHFNRRFEEGFDITDDALYVAWAKLKRASQPLANISNTRGTFESSNAALCHPSTTIQSLLSEAVKLPEPAQQTKKSTRGTANLPTHLPSKEMVKFLEEKMKKDREIQDREERKAAREARKRQREEEKQQKAAKRAKTAKKQQKHATTQDRHSEASSTPDTTVCPVCDEVYKEEGEDSSVWVDCSKTASAIVYGLH